MTQLDYYKDGINAVDLGVIGECQYALDFMGQMAANVWRRKASEVGTYGGWRWECGSSHPSNVMRGNVGSESLFAQDHYTLFGTLADRIERAITEHRAALVAS